MSICLFCRTKVRKSVKSTKKNMAFSANQILFHPSMQSYRCMLHYYFHDVKIYYQTLKINFRDVIIYFQGMKIVFHACRVRDFQL